MTASGVQTRTFCCCIPARAGVIVLALIGFLGGGVISAVAIMGLKASAGLEKSMGLQVAAFIILTLVSLLGVIGGIARKLVLVRVYFGLIIFQIMFSMGAGIYAIFRVFKDAPNYIKDCQLPDAADADKVAASCKAGMDLLKGLMITAFIFAWLLQIGAAVIVHRYSRQLEDEEETRSIVKDTETW